MAVSLAQWGNDLYTGKKSYNIIGRRKMWFMIAILLVVGSAALLLIRGLSPSIEFSGGSQFVVSNVSPNDGNQTRAATVVEKVNPAEVARVTKVGTASMQVQTSRLSNDEVEETRNALAQEFGVPTTDVTSAFVGASWGRDVLNKAITGMVVFLALVTLVLAVYFRAWRMAVAALLALLHDLIVTVGIYCLVGWEVSPASVIGFLTILGYSMYDTVVVFDKVRENTAGVLDQSRYTYDEAANLAVNQTLVRSINTSVIAILPVAAILFIGALLMGAGTLRDISLALFVGMAVGTFSSIFLATPLEVGLRDFEPAIKAHTEKVLKARASRGGDDPEGTGSFVTGAMMPGMHLGTQAQPKRKRRAER